LFYIGVSSSGYTASDEGTIRKGRIWKDMEATVPTRGTVSAFTLCYWRKLKNLNLHIRYPSPDLNRAHRQQKPWSLSLHPLLRTFLILSSSRIRLRLYSDERRTQT